MSQIFNPVTGKTISPSSADELIDAVQWIKDTEAAVRMFKQAVYGELVRMAKDVATRTKRVSGEKRRVVLEMPSDSWDRGVLKFLFHSRPEYRERFLRISEVAVNLIEFKKALNEVGTDGFGEYFAELKAANLGPKGLPTVTIEE